MPRVEEYQLHPLGWENDPEVERFKLGVLDYLSTMTWTSTVLFFKVNDITQKNKIVAILKEGLERTLAQARQQVGRIEKDGNGGHVILRKKTDTVQFVVQHLDSPEDNYPSFEDIANTHFCSPILGDINIISNSPMTVGNKPEAHPDNHPIISSYKANFIRGGLIFNIHNHHWSQGLSGAITFDKQLAANCYAIANKTEFPSWDPRWLDRSSYGLPGFEKVDTSKKAQVEAPRRLDRSVLHKPSRAVIFHLPKSKAAELKKSALPSDGSQISTYNAVCALLWRVLTKLRDPVYKPDPDFKPVWGQGVSLSKLFTDPPLPTQLQMNFQFDITSKDSPVPQPTLSEIISGAPLSKLATYIRLMTESVTLDMLYDKLEQFERVRNKEDLSINVDSLPPMSMLITDWRSCDICNMDFGFGMPSGFRHLFGGAPLSLVLVYPPHKGPAGAGEDEGIHLQITFEAELVDQLIRDPDWNKYFEYRGVEAYEEKIESSAKPKL